MSAVFFRANENRSEEATSSCLSDIDWLSIRTNKTEQEVPVAKNRQLDAEKGEKKKATKRRDGGDSEW